MFLLVLLAASSAPVFAQTTHNPEFRDVIDETGRTVHLPQPVKRIVSLAPSLTETVYALGLQDRLVGDTDYCDYPADAQNKPKVGGAINPSLEEIAHLQARRGAGDAPFKYSGDRAFTGRVGDRIVRYGSSQCG